ncbi:ATP-binding protein [Desulfobacca acetoxidans]
MSHNLTVLPVPTINDHPVDFDQLFHLWNSVNDDNIEVEFNFTRCRFLRHNAVAFLGGLARLVAYRGGRINFRWNTLDDAIYTNLAQNGFIGCLGGGPNPWTGNSIPYEEFPVKNKEAITSYLKSKWLGRGWVNVSQALRDAIVGQVWEIFENAFEHSYSPLGVFCCGQHYPRLSELKLCVADFGVGIPSNVRLFKKREEVSAAAALRWAFQPGTTTKPNGMGKGMGLDLLREFIKVNKGSLEVYSHEGYVSINAARRFFRTEPLSLRGPW